MSAQRVSARTTHPYRGVAIGGVFNTPAARVMPGHDSFTVTLAAVRGALRDAGVSPYEVDGFFGQHPAQLIYTLGAGPAMISDRQATMAAVVEAANAIALGTCQVAVVAGGQAGVYKDRGATAPWTRPQNEFVAPFGMYTAVEFALIARRHMAVYGTQPEHLAKVAATIRNNGHVNPDAALFGRGPFTVEDILASRMIADPFHLLDCAMVSEGGCAVVLAAADRALDMPRPPVYILGAASDRLGPPYQYPPSWDLRSVNGEFPNGYIGRRAARAAFAMSGLAPRDVDVCEFFDPFSFEIIRQFEAFEFCSEGEGPDFVMSGAIDPGGKYPVTTDGGTMSFSHPGGGSQQLQRVIRCVQQLRGECKTNQVANAEIAMGSNGGAGALYNDVMLLGRERP